ncbi:MAG: MFS transporter, partial [Chloroflexota bacterium]
MNGEAGPSGASRRLSRPISLVRENPVLFTIALATTVSMMGNSAAGPVLPLFARSFGAGATVVGVVVGSFGFSRLFVNIPSGIVGEKYGRTALMAGGLGFMSFGHLMAGFSGSALELVAWRVVTGVGSAAFMTGAMAYIADISTPGNRARLMSVRQGSLLAGTTFGPLIGGVLGDFAGLQWPFFFAAALTAIGAVWVAVRLPNRPPSASEGRGRRPEAQSGEETQQGSPTRAMLTNPTFIIVAVFGMMIFFTRSGSRQSIVPLLATEELGMSASLLGVMIFVMTLMNFLTIWPAARLSDRLGRKATMVPGIAVAAGGLALFAIAPNIPMLFVSAVVMGAGMGVGGVAPQAFAGDL